VLLLVIEGRTEILSVIY